MTGGIRMKSLFFVCLMVFVGLGGCVEDTNTDPMLTEEGALRSDSCDLPADPGLCKAAFSRWYFDTNTGTCEPFVYGGCGGNENNFETLGDCESSCATPVTCEDGDGTVYNVGDSFDAGDGCNTCTCTDSGLIACTLMACVCTTPYTLCKNAKQCARSLGGKRNDWRCVDKKPCKPSVCSFDGSCEPTICTMDCRAPKRGEYGHCEAR